MEVRFLGLSYLTFVNHSICSRVPNVADDAYALGHKVCGVPSFCLTFFLSHVIPQTWVWRQQIVEAPRRGCAPARLGVTGDLRPEAWQASGDFLVSFE